MKNFNKEGRKKLWQKYSKDIPDNDYFLTFSCILSSFYPASEVMVTKVYDLLDVNWKMTNDSNSGWSCCTGIGYHGDIMPLESTLLTVARLWSLAQNASAGVITPTCVTSFGIHCECKEFLEHDPELRKRIALLLEQTCGRKLYIPEHIVHTSDVYYRHREQIKKHFKHSLTEIKTGRPLKVVDHIGCHYSKLFPNRHAHGGSEYCEVLAGMVRSWGAENIDYPERRHCCGMGFRQCMIPPNRGATLSNVYKKIKSMAPFEPDLIVTNCPGCQVFLDKEQWAIYESTGEEYFIPVLTYQELAGLLLGWDPYDVVGIDSHTVPVEPLLDKIGIAYEKEKSMHQDNIKQKAGADI